MSISQQELAGIMNHMNEDHEASLVLYAHAYAQRKEITSAKMIGLTQDTLSLQLPNEEQLDIPLISAVNNAKDAHIVLVKMHKQALEQLQS